MKVGGLAVLAFLTTSAVANAASVLTVAGPPVSFVNQQVLSMSWGQSVTYSNIAITMPLQDSTLGGPIGGVEGTAYLMNQIGPGTTPANEVVPPAAVSGLPATFAPRTLFSGLTLPAGTYFVVLVSTNTSPLSMSPAGTLSPVVTSGVGVGVGGGAAAVTPAAYPPATTVGPNMPLLITITGDLGIAAPASVPTISTSGIGVLVLCVLAVTFFVTRRRAA